jgi:hypothetical protein
MEALQALGSSGATVPENTVISRKSRHDRSTRKCCNGLIFATKMVAGEGIEPPTRGFSIPCSTN